MRLCGPPKRAGRKTKKALPVKAEREALKALKPKVREGSLNSSSYAPWGEERLKSYGSGSLKGSGIGELKPLAYGGGDLRPPKEKKDEDEEEDKLNRIYELIVNQHGKILPPPKDPREAFLRFKEEETKFPFVSLVLGVFAVVFSVFLVFASESAAFRLATAGLFTLGFILLISAFLKIRRRRGEERRLCDFTERALRGERFAIEEFMEAILSRIDWRPETSATFEVSNCGTFVSVDVNLPEIEDLESGVLLSGKARRGAMKSPKREDRVIQGRYRRMVHSIILRIAGEVFYQFPTVRKVLASGYTDRVDPATGLQKSEYVISVVFNRELWTTIAPASADPVLCVGLFPVRRDSGEDSIMRAIEPFAPE
jgi:hypothetical protein